jgi:hypothetical protein
LKRVAAWWEERAVRVREARAWDDRVTGVEEEIMGVVVRSAR